MIDALTAMAGFVLAISLSQERLVTLAKTKWTWLREDRPTDAEEQTRRLVVQLLAFAFGFGITVWLAQQPDAQRALSATQSNTGFNWSVAIPNGPSLNVLIVALLATGGSAMWKDVLGFTNEVKRIREKAREREEDLTKNDRRMSTESRRMGSSPPSSFPHAGGV